MWLHFQNKIKALLNKTQLQTYIVLLCNVYWAPSHDKRQMIKLNTLPVWFWNPPLQMISIMYRDRALPSSSKLIIACAVHVSQWQTSVPFCSVLTLCLPVLYIEVYTFNYAEPEFFFIMACFWHHLLSVLRSIDSLKVICDILSIKAAKYESSIQNFTLHANYK